MGFDLRVMTSKFVFFFPTSYSVDTDTQPRKIGPGGQGCLLHRESQCGHRGLRHCLLPILGTQSPDWATSSQQEMALRRSHWRMSPRALGMAEGRDRGPHGRECVEGRKVVGFQLDEFLAGSLRNLIKNHSVS